MSKINNYWLYILKLDNGKYCTGITCDKYMKNDNTKLLNKHYMTKWSKKHKPESIVKIKDLGNISKHDAKTTEREELLFLQEKYGFYNTCMVGVQPKLPRSLRRRLDNKDDSILNYFIGLIATIVLITVAVLILNIRIQ